MPGFTRENHETGMLVDDDWMAGISREPEGFSAFVVEPRSGSLIAHQTFPNLDMAINAVNKIPRDWKYEATAGCSGERCGEGKCKGAACRIFSGPRIPSGACEQALT